MVSLLDDKLPQAEHKLVTALVRSNRGKIFDMTLLPRVRLAACADD